MKQTSACLSYPQTQTAETEYTHYAWLVIILSAAFLMYKYILQVSPSVMTTELMQQFHINGTGLGNLAAMFFYAYLFTQLFVGPLLDKYNPRLLTALAIFVSGCGMLFFSYAEQLTTATIARGLAGVGAAFATVSYMKMTTLWFKPQQFALVGGLLATAAMLGSMAGQAPLALLVSHTGWQTSLYICGVIGLIFAALYLIFVKNPPGYQAATTTAVSSKQQILSVLKNKANWYLMAYSGLAFSPLAVFGGLWGNPFLQVQYGFSKTGAAYELTFLFLGLALGAPCLGYLSERFKQHFTVLFSGLLLSGTAIILLVYFPEISRHQIAIPLFFFGFGTGSFMLGFTLGKYHNPLPLAATVVAMINTGDALFGAVTEPMIGKILDSIWHGQWQNGIHYFTASEYQTAFIMLPAYLVIALFFIRRYQKIYLKQK